MPAPTTDHSPVARAAQALAGRTPLGLGAWREVQRTGELPGDPDPDGTAAGLVRRWHQHLAVAMDLALEREAPGEDRLPVLLTAWLDLARRTSPVRAHVARTAGPRTAAESARQAALLVRLLSDDLAVLGAASPERSAADLLRELALVAQVEDARGGVDRAARAALLGTAGLPDPAPLRRRGRRLVAA